MKRFIFLFLFLPFVLHAQTFVGTGGSIPDFPGGEVCFNLNVSGLPQNLYSGSGLVSVQLNITHTYDGDLEIVLESPSGIRTILSSNNGGSGDNYTNTIFTMGAINPIQTGSAPFSGSYIPEESFYTQNSGQNGNGIWRLCITDELGGDIGTLNSWSITFGAGAIGSPTPNPNPVATDSCFNAPLICNLNGYTGSTNTTYTWSNTSPFESEPRGTSQGPNAGSFCGTHVENSSWIRFQASSSTVTLDVDVTNCTGTVAVCGERGIQIALYNACGFPWTYSASSIPTSSFADCFNNEKSPSCYGDGIYGLNNIITFNNLTVGNIYYIMFDGWASNRCDYSIRVNNGVQVVDITPSSNPICQGDTITLTANAPGVLNTYAWSSVPPGSYSNNQQISVSPSSTTTYTVTASGICGSQSATIPVTVTPSGDPSWGTPNDICENAPSLNLNSFITGTTGGSWSGNGVTGSSFDPSGLNGNIPVVYTTGTAPCQRTDTNFIFVLPVPDPQIQINGPTGICSYQNILLTAPSPVSGTYLWNTGSTNDSIWTTTSGQYIVTVSNLNGCFDRDTIQLNVTNYPPVNPIITPSNPVICPGIPATLALTTGYSTYLWSNSSVTPTIQVTTPGNYNVIVTDANGCQDTAQINVLQSLLSVDIAGDLELCQGETSLLSVSGSDSYLWSTGSVNSSIHTSSQGWYWVDAADTLGCTVRDSVYITLSVLSIGVSGDNIICASNDSSLLIATASPNYSWSNGATSQNILVYQPGTYWVSTIDTLGCTDTAFFNVNQSIVNAMIMGDTSACNNETITLTASGGANYSWATGESTAEISPTITQTFTYQVTVTNLDGCSSTAIHTVYLYSLLNDPPVGVSDSSSTQINVPVLIDVMANDSTNNAIISIFIPPVNGTVTIVGNQIQYVPNDGFIGTDEFYYLLCSDICNDYCDTVYVKVDITNTALLFPEFISPNNDGVNDTWVISGLENYPDHEVIIMNRWGDAFYTAKPYTNDWQGQSNTGLVMINGQATDGTYFFVFIPAPGEDPVKGFIELRK